MLNKLISVLVFYFLIGLIIDNVYAVKILPRFKMIKKGGGSSYSGVVVAPRLRGDRKALNVYFSNLSKAKNVTYTLIYETNGKDEGVSGSLDSSGGDAANRELLFGTCSSGVCRYHSSISSMRFEVVSELTSGKKLLRRFRIRV